MDVISNKIIIQWLNFDFGMRMRNSLAMLKRSGTYPWGGLFSLWVLHGLIAFGQILSGPSRPLVLAGLSRLSLLVGGFLLVWIVLNLVLIILVIKGTGWLRLIMNAACRLPLRDILLAAALLIVLLRIYFLTLSGVFSEELILRYDTTIDRLLPVMDLMTFVCLEIAVLILFFTYREYREFVRPSRVFLIRLSGVLLVLGIAAAIVAISGLGIVPGYEGDWSRGLPAVPLLEWQIVLACLFAVGMIVLEARGRISNLMWLDAVICLAIGLGAVLIWLGQPVLPNASALEPHEPNFEIYPFLDAQTYDEFAQSVLVGDGFGKDPIPQRPLYIVFLALIHAAVGQGYDRIVLVQTLFFSMFPVVLYLFGKEFSGRPIGIALAVLAVLRDYLSNLVSPFTGNISYTKLYLAEIPTAICIIIFLLVAMRWIKAGFPAFWGFLLGGILGFGMLIRTQVLVVLPAALLFALLVQPKRVVALARSVLLMCLATMLVISPWLWRNWIVTGELIFDNPASQTANLALRYSRLNGIRVDITPQPGESITTYNDRLVATASRAISSNPVGAIRAVANFFLNHGVNNVLLFPLRDELKDFNELLIPSYAFWERWEGRPNLSQGIFLVFYLFLLGLGLAAAWHRNGWLGLLPLLANLLYNLWTSLALLSGQRFMLTMDWSVYLYYMIGMFVLLSGSLSLLNSGRTALAGWRQASTCPVAAPPGVRAQTYLIAGLVFLGVGLSLPLTERLFPTRYPALSREASLQRLLASPALERAGLKAACLQAAVGNNGLTFLHGRALYPRYYHAGDGESFTDSVGYKKTDEGRLVFEMVGQYNGRVIFPMAQQPAFFPNAADVSLGRDEKENIWFVFVETGGAAMLYMSESFDPVGCE